MKTIWNRITRSFSRPEPAPAAAPPPPPTLDEARQRLSGLDGNPLTVHQQLTFAESLLVAVGENPATPENQVLAHQMAIAQLEMRGALLARQ
jgi:hypothetical protein